MYMQPVMLSAIHTIYCWRNVLMFVEEICEATEHNVSKSLFNLCSFVLFVYTNLRKEFSILWTYISKDKSIIWWQGGGQSTKQTEWSPNKSSDFRLPFQWRHNGCNGVSNRQPHDCFLKRLFKAQIKENIKALHHWPWCGEFTGDRWIPCTIDQ